MSSLVACLLIFVCCVSASTFHKSVVLNSTHSYTEGINVTISTTNVQITDDNIWQLDPISQAGTDLQLHLSDEWGFHPDVNSTITLTMHIDAYSTGPLLVLFSVANQQYFSLYIDFETSATWKSFPGPESALSLTDDVLTDIILPEKPTRYYRLSNGTQGDKGLGVWDDHWVDISPVTSDTNELQWALKLELVNDPITQRLSCRCSVGEQALFVSYTSSFETEQGLNVFLMTSDQPIDISSINVSYSHSQQTMAHSVQTPAPILQVGKTGAITGSPMTPSDVAEASVDDTNTTTTTTTSLMNTKDDSVFTQRAEVMRIYGIAINKWSIGIAIMILGWICCMFMSCLAVCVAIRSRAKAAKTNYEGTKRPSISLVASSPINRYLSGAIRRESSDDDDEVEDSEDLYIVQHREEQTKAETVGE